MAASIDYSNPLAQWSNPWTRLFGSSGYGIIGGNNQIAQFSDPVAGGSANVATMLAVYGNSSVADMINKWSGGNNSSNYTNYVVANSGVDPSATVRDVLQGPQGPSFLHSMAQWEAGPNATPSLSLGDWTTALTQGFAAVGGTYSGAGDTSGGGGGVQQAGVFTPYLGGSKGGNTTGAVAQWFKPITDWLNNAMTRGALIVLGIVMIAIGLAMFGRGAVVAQTVGDTTVIRRKSAFGTRLAVRRASKQSKPAPAAATAPIAAPAAPVAAAPKTRRERAKGGRIRYSTIRVPRNRLEEAVRRAQRAAGRDRANKNPRPINITPDIAAELRDQPAPREASDQTRARRHRKSRSRNTPD